MALTNKKKEKMEITLFWHDPLKITQDIIKDVFYEISN